MNAKHLIVGLVLACVIPAASADDGYLGGSSAVGQVRAVYVRQSGGLFVEEGLKPNLSGERWVEIRFAEPLADGRKGATAMIPEDTRIDRGDLVEVRFAHTGRVRVAPVREVNRVTAVSAKYYTAEARNYGRPAGTPTLLERLAYNQ